MKWLQITSSLGMINSFLLYKVSRTRCLLNSLLVLTSVIVHRNFPAKNSNVLVIDKLLAKTMALSNYYYGCMYYDRYLSFGEHHFFMILCILSYLQVRKTANLLFHTVVHICWHVTTLGLALDLIQKS